MKFRKELYEDKGAFSNTGFFRPIYDTIQKGYSERHPLPKKTSLGRDFKRLKAQRDEVLTEIQELTGLCKVYKSPNKKRKHDR